MLKGDSVVSFEQFFQLVNVLEDLANPADDEDDSGSGSGSSGEPTMEADGEDYDEIDEEAETEMLTDIYKVRTQVSLSYSLLLSYL